MRWSPLTVTLGAVVLATTLALSGCGSGAREDHSSAPAADSVGGDSAAVGTDEQAAPAAPDKPSAGGGVPADLRLDQRTIIYTGSIVVRVKDVDEAAAGATSIATGAGGFVGADKRTSNDSKAEAVLELRVPADEFGDVVNRIAGLGDQQRRDIDTQDVTEESLDLDARIATQQARVESGRRLLARAETLNDLILLEGELAKREADLASLEAKKRRLDDLTALSTITVRLLGPNATASDDDGSQTGFLVGLDAGWRAFLASMRILLTVLGALLPWFIALGVPVFGLIWLVRRIGRGRRPAPPLAPVGPPHPMNPTAPSGPPIPSVSQAPSGPVVPAARDASSDQ